MRVERLAALAIAIVVASAGSAGAIEHGTDIRTLHAQAAQSGPAASPAEQHPPAAKKKETAPPPHRARVVKRKPKPKHVPIVESQECVWVGKRTIRVLMRDDLIAADGFLKFYRVFGCPVQHLGKAFGCSLIGTSGAPAKAVEDRVDVCWKDPNAQPAAGAEPAPQAAPAGKPPAKPAPPKAMPKSVSPAPKPAPPAKPKPEPDTAYPKR